MQQYDVIIVGGGPAGLECARQLSRSDLHTLLLEKQGDFGNKLCAGGLTMKGMQLLSLPDQLLQQGVKEASLHSRKRSAHTRTTTPFLFTVNRVEMGSWQRSLLNVSNVEIRTRSQVAKISSGEVTLKTGEVLGYRFLVGADGHASIVRRHLGLKTKKRLMGYQYTIPAANVDPVMKIFLDARRFHLWYAWMFPHRTTMAVGCCCDPKRVDHLKVRRRFQEWLGEKGIDPGNALLESYPIGCDYRGYRFGNIFLVGEAAGLASWLTGEGIWQSLVSGREVACMIMDPGHDPAMLHQVLKYNRMLERVMLPFLLAGPMRGLLQDLLVFLINRRRVRIRVNKTFT